MKLALSELETNVLRLKAKGYTFNKIAESLGKNSYQQIQEIYGRALKKLRVWNYLNKHDKHLIRAAGAYGYSFDKLMKLCSFLQNKNLLKTYYQMPTKDLAGINYLNSNDLEVLIASKKYRYSPTE